MVPSLRSVTAPPGNLVAVFRCHAAGRLPLRDHSMKAGHETRRATRYKSATPRSRSLLTAKGRQHTWQVIGFDQDVTCLRPLAGPHYVAAFQQVHEAARLGEPD